jgi:TPR repeat protein
VCGGYDGDKFLGERATMKKLLILLFTIFLSVGSLSAQSADVKKLIQLANQGDVEAQYKLGVSYYNGEGVTQDYVEAMKWFRLAAGAQSTDVKKSTEVMGTEQQASEGNLIAQYDLGVRYATGRGVPQDYAQAVKWFRLSADQGFSFAQYNLAVMYANGRGVPQDYAQAVKWYRLAADQGHTSAQYNLAFKYDKGEGVPQDYAQAVKWYRLAADQGHTSAQYNLGVMYAKGRGVPQDDVQAHMWFNLAAAQGDEDGKQGRDLVAGKMTPQQIAQAQELARNWKPKKK